jgi:hypothetical protein
MNPRFDIRRIARQMAIDQTNRAIKVLTTEPKPLPPLTDEEQAIISEARRLLKRPAGHWEPYGPDDDPWQFNMGGRWGKYVYHPCTADEEAVINQAMAIMSERDRLAWGEE